MFVANALSRKIFTFCWEKKNQAGRWTVDTDDSHYDVQQLQEQRRLLARLRGGKLWGFAKASVLEFLVASRVRREVLEEGKRRPLDGDRGEGGGGGRSKEDGSGGVGE